MCAELQTNHRIGEVIHKRILQLTKAKLILTSDAVHRRSERRICANTNPKTNMYPVVHRKLFLQKRPQKLFAFRTVRKKTHNVMHVPEESHIQFLKSFLEHEI